MRITGLTILLPATAAGLAALALVDAAAKSFLLLLLAAAACLVWRGGSAAGRHLLWLSAVTAALMMPALSLVMPQWGVLPAWLSLAERPAAVPAGEQLAGDSVAQHAAAAIDRTSAVHRAEPERTAAAARPADSARTEAVQVSPAAQPRLWRIDPAWLLGIWAGGALALLVPIARGAWKIRRLAQASAVVTAGPLHAAAVQVAAELRVRRPTLLLGPAGAMPMVWGILHGRVRLPSEAAGWTAERLRAVLLHELAHLRRRDPLTLLIGQLNRAVYWFNPLAWLALRQLRIERERACDDYVLRGGVRPSAYAAHVLEIATSLRPAVDAAVGLAMADRLRIEGRVQTILDVGRNRRVLSPCLMAALLLGAAAAAFSLSLLRAADSPEQPAQPAATGDVEPEDAIAAFVWGPEQDGWQLGAGWKDGKLRYRQGETLEFELKARNLTDRPNSVSLPVIRDWDLTYFGAGELLVRAFGSDQQEVTLAVRSSADPWEDRTIEVPTPRIRPDGLPGARYTVRFNVPRQGRREPLQSDEFGFHYDAPAAAESPERHPDEQYRDVHWSEPVLGLRFGLRWTSATRVLEDSEWEFLLWNAAGGATPQEVTVSYLAHHPLDWQMRLRDDSGADVPRIAIPTGPKTQVQSTLQPDEVVSLGTTDWRRLASGGGREPGGRATDRLDPAREYEVSASFNCRRMDAPQINLHIRSPWVPVELAAAGNDGAGRQPAEDEDAVPEDEASAHRPPVVMGLDLSAAPAAAHPSELPDLFEPAPDQPGEWQQRRGVFQMPLEPNDETQYVWLAYPAALERFYIEYRSDRDDPTTERTYGPFEGDPFERLKLEELMAQRIQSDPPADMFRIRQMLRIGERGLAERAVRLMRGALTSSAPLYAKEIHYLGPVERMLDEHAADFERHGLEAQAAELRDALTALKRQIDELTVTIPDESYIRAADYAREVPDRIPAGSWGEPSGGLRLAAVPEPDSVPLGDAVRFHLIVENVGDEETRFSARDLVQDARAEVRTPRGDQLQTHTTWFSGWRIAQHYLLRPGERIVLAGPSVLPVEDLEQGGSVLGQTKALLTGRQDLRNSVLLVRYQINLGLGSSWSRGDDGVMRRTSPATGEWSGSLTSGQVAIAVARPAAADAEGGQ